MRQILAYFQEPRRRQLDWLAACEQCAHDVRRIDGIIAASDANLAVRPIIITGHGPPVSNRAELKDFRDMLVVIRENVATLKKQGRSREEAVAARPTAAFDGEWGNFSYRSGLFYRIKVNRP